jgi:hypothetical protein
MIWDSPIEIRPIEGDLKVVTKFALFPKRVGNKKVWLESYQQLYEYKYLNTHMISGKVIGPQVRILDWELIGEKTMRGIPEMYNPPPPPNSNERQKKEWEEFVKEKTKEQFQ